MGTLGKKKGGAIGKSYLFRSAEDTCGIK